MLYACITADVELRAHQPRFSFTIGTTAALAKHKAARDHFTARMPVRSNN